MRFLQPSAYLFLMLIGFVSLVEARVVRMEITSKKDVLGGQLFGNGGDHTKRRSPIV
jgi:hypothetical protein